MALNLVDAQHSSNIKTDRKLRKKKKNGEID